MRYSKTRFMQAVDLLGEVLAASEPAERSVEKFFRRNKQMGSKDRRSTSGPRTQRPKHGYNVLRLARKGGLSTPRPRTQGERKDRNIVARFCGMFPFF